MDEEKLYDLSRQFPGTFFIHGGFYEPLREKFIEYLRDTDAPNLIFFIDSKGGDLRVLKSMCSLLKLSGKKATAVVTGVANSCGYHFMQYCQNRVAVSGATLLPHWGRIGFGNSDIGGLMVTLLPLFSTNRLSDVELAELTVLANGDVTAKSFADDYLYLVRLTQSRTGLGLAKVISLFSQEPDISAPQALSLKLIDKVVEDDDLPTFYETLHKGM